MARGVLCWRQGMGMKAPGLVVTVIWLSSVASSVGAMPNDKKVPPSAGPAPANIDGASGTTGRRARPTLGGARDPIQGRLDPTELGRYAAAHGKQPADGPAAGSREPFRPKRPLGTAPPPFAPPPGQRAAPGRKTPGPAGGIRAEDLESLRRERAASQEAPRRGPLARWRARHAGSP